MPDLVKELEVRVKFISDVKKLAIPDSKKSYDSLEKLNKSLIDTIKLYKDIADKSPWAKEVLAINKATAALSRYNAELAKGSGGGAMGRARDALGRFTPMGRAGKAASLLGVVSAATPSIADLISQGGGEGYQGRRVSGDESRYADAATAGLGGGAFNDPVGRTSGQIGAWFGNNSPILQRMFGGNSAGSRGLGLFGVAGSKFSEQEERIKEQRAYQAQLKQFRDAKQARQIERIGERSGARLEYGSAFQSPEVRLAAGTKELSRMQGLAGSQEEQFGGGGKVANLQAQMEAAKVMKSAQEDMNKAKADELDKEGKIVDQQQRKVELLKAQLDRAKEINNATAASVGKASTSEINRAKELMAKIKGGGELTGREADFLTKFGPAGSKIADEARQKMGREKGGSLIADLDKAAGFDVEGKQQKYDEANKNYKESQAKYDEHMKEFQTNMRTFTEDMAKTFREINKALITALQKMREQNDAENFNIPVG